MLLLKDLSSVLVNDVALLVDQVASRVDWPSKVICQFTLLVSQRDDLTVSIFVELTQGISHIKSSATIVE